MLSCMETKMSAKRLSKMLFEFGMYEPCEFDNAILTAYSEDNGETWIQTNQDIDPKDTQYKIIVMQV